MTERTSHAEAFKSGGTVDRSAGLAGLLPARRAVATTPAIPAVPDSAAALSNLPSRPRVDKADATKVTNMAVYLPEPLLAKLRQAKRDFGGQYADILMDAFDDTNDETLSKKFKPDPEPTTGRAPRRPQRPTDVAGVQVQLRLTKGQIAWVDELKERVGAPSRSRLSATVLDLYLASPKSSSDQ
jgi:hypothetical protein